jgi:hypothetical protein
MKPQAEARVKSVTIEVLDIGEPYVRLDSLVKKRNIGCGEYWSTRMPKGPEKARWLYPTTPGKYKFTFSLDPKPGFTKLEVRAAGIFPSEQIVKGKNTGKKGPCGDFVEDLFGWGLWGIRKHLLKSMKYRLQNISGSERGGLNDS